MTNDERDLKINETHLLTKQTHAAMFGNGKPGLKAEFERVKGIVYFLSFIVPFITFLLALAMAICKMKG